MSRELVWTSSGRVCIASAKTKGGMRAFADIIFDGTTYSVYVSALPSGQRNRVFDTLDEAMLFVNSIYSLEGSSA